MTSVYETAANEVVPAIRSYIAKELMEKHKMSEERVAVLLDVAQAAVSKYINEKYSNRVKEMEAKLNKELIDKYIAKIAEGQKAYVSACICRLCHSVNKFDCAFSSAESVKV